MRKHLPAAWLCCTLLVPSITESKVIRVPGGFPTINGALTSADYGDTVLVSPGRYRENITLVQGVTLLGTNPLECIIDGMRKGPTVYMVTGSEIGRFTITNGIDGILCENASGYIHHNWIIDNQGAGIGAFISLPQIYNNVVYGNRWSGILAWGAKSLDTRIENNVVLRNGYSGLTLKGPSRIMIRNNILMENHEYGVYSDPASGQSQIIYNNIFKNVIPFNRYSRVNKTNISNEPMFLNPSLGSPNFFVASKSPMVRRGYGQVDIGLLAKEVPAQIERAPDPIPYEEPAPPPPVVMTKPAPPPPPPPPKREIKPIEENFIVEGIVFATGSAEILEESFQHLDYVYEQLMAVPDRRFEISGHTDNTGSDKINNQLSYDRANAVREYLVNRGIQGGRLVAKGYGSTKPKATNNTAAGRQINRRIEFYRIK